MLGEKIIGKGPEGLLLMSGKKANSSGVLSLVLMKERISRVGGKISIGLGIDAAVLRFVACCSRG